MQQTAILKLVSLPRAPADIIYAAAPIINKHPLGTNIHTERVYKYKKSAPGIYIYNAHKSINIRESTRNNPRTPESWFICRLNEFRTLALVHLFHFICIAHACSDKKYNIYVMRIWARSRADKPGSWEFACNKKIIRNGYFRRRRENLVLHGENQSSGAPLYKSKEGELMPSSVWDTPTRISCLSLENIPQLTRYM